MESEQHDLTPQQMLKASLLFQGANDEILDLIVTNLETVTFKKGDPIILENEISNHVYFIKSGQVEIIKYRTQVKQVSRVAVLKAGNHFSEFSVLNHSHKSASAFALEDCELYRMNGTTFLKILVKFPELAQRLVHSLAELNHSFSKASSIIDYFNPSMLSYHPEALTILPQPTWRRFGVLPLRYYSGTLLVAAKDPNKQPFFEFCRSTLAKIQVNMTLISEVDFDRIEKKIQHLYASATPEITTPPSSPETDVKAFLKACAYFHGFPENVLDQLVATTESISYNAGDVVFSPQDPSEHFCLVISGCIEMVRKVQNSWFWSHVIQRHAGDGIAEASLLLDHPHALLAKATMPTRVLKIPKAVFTQLLSSGVFCLNLAKVLAQRLQVTSEMTGLKFHDKDTTPSKEALSLLPSHIIKQHQVLPLRIQDREVTLGLVNPDNDAIYSLAGRYLRGYRIQLEMITPEQLAKWIPTEGDVAVKANTPKNTVIDLNHLISEGFNSRASDLHLEPTPAGYSVRYRIDGVLTEMTNRIPRITGEELVNRIKVLSNLDIANHQVPQDGQLKMAVGSSEYMARVSVVPTKQGENAVLRLIRSRNSVIPLSMLAPDLRTIKLLKEICRYKQGLFLVSGPTGSGKTTTLYSLISELNRIEAKILSLEDPVELEIPGVTQIEINEKSGLTFPRALKSTLRQDPDVVVVGEIRDDESAKIVFDAALSGHLVISTVHTNSSFSIRNRLKELGVPSGTLSAGLIGSMAQRLVRILCKKCVFTRPATLPEIELLTDKLHLKNPPKELFAAKGCEHCHGTGFQDRMPVFEIWRKDHKMEELLARDAEIEELLNVVRADSFDTLLEFGLKMALNGLTTVEEVERCLAGSV